MALCREGRFTNGPRVIFRLIVYQTIRFQRNGAGRRQKDTKDLILFLILCCAHLKILLLYATHMVIKNQNSIPVPYAASDLCNHLLTCICNAHIFTDQICTCIHCVLNVSYLSLFYREKISHVILLFWYSHCIFPPHRISVFQIPLSD